MNFSKMFFAIVALSVLFVYLDCGKKNPTSSTPKTIYDTICGQSASYVVTTTPDSVIYSPNPIGTWTGTTTIQMSGQNYPVTFKLSVSEVVASATTYLYTLDGSVTSGSVTTLIEEQTGVLNMQGCSITLISTVCKENNGANILVPVTCPTSDAKFTISGKTLITENATPAFILTWQSF